MRTFFGKLANSFGIPINPATEDKQDDVIAGINGEDMRDFFNQIVRGKITGMSRINLVGHNPDVDPGVEETIWEQGGLYTYLTANTTLKASSSSASDVGNVILAIGVRKDDNGDYESVVRTATLDGQNKVTFSGDIFRLNFIAVLTAGKNIGDVYAYEDDTIAGGVPDTVSKIKCKMLADRKFGTTGTLSIPNGFIAYGYNIEGTLNKGKDANLFYKNRNDPDDDFTIPPPFDIVEGQFVLSNIGGAEAPGNTDIELSYTTNFSDSSVSTAQRYFLIDDTLTV